MTLKPDNEGQRFVDHWRAEAERLYRDGLYDPAQEHGSCGVGLVAAIDGKPRREVVVAGINALKAVWHRGAVDADGKTGDGAGIHVQIPQDFFREHIARTGHEPGSGRLAVGMMFLPKTDFAAQEHCRCVVETEILRFGYSIYGWRQVPVDVSVIGEKANATRPEIEQIMIASNPGVSEQQFELDLFIIRRRIEKWVLDEHITDFYVCSLSCRSVIYKGLFLAEQLTAFYPDLLDERFVSSFAIFHQRYSTNTFPNWPLAQPFRMLAHNGEINTLRGNSNWMRSHETRMAATVFGEFGDDIKPVIQSGSSDSAALDAVFEVMVRAGRSAPMVKSLMIPDSWSNKATMPQRYKDFYSYCNCVMEPWDGPAAVAATDGRWVIAGMDRNGLRPMRFTRTADGLLIVGSESGMVPVKEAEVLEKGRVGPGEMIGVDLEDGRFYHDRELKDMLARSHPYHEWVRNMTLLDNQIKRKHAARPEFSRTELRRR
ncbi:MAG: glutamate synthase large subunit, partial [Alphaproteobacteria bacterium]|nr:glutamate synthase large subunit [Alphaproteobacteria bacterium]